MAILRHLDKAVFLALLVLTLWYGVSTVRLMSRAAEDRVALLERAERLSAEVRTISVPPPPKDDTRFVGRIKSQWSDIPWVVSLDSLHFYPGAKRTP